MPWSNKSGKRSWATAYSSSSLYSFFFFFCLSDSQPLGQRLDPELSSRPWDSSEVQKFSSEGAVAINAANTPPQPNFQAPWPDYEVLCARPGLCAGLGQQTWSTVQGQGGGPDLVCVWVWGCELGRNHMLTPCWIKPTDQSFALDMAHKLTPLIWLTTKKIGCHCSIPYLYFIFFLYNLKS